MAIMNILDLLNSPTMTIGLIFFIFLGIAAFLYRKMNENLYGVIQLSELDHQGEFLKIIDDKETSSVSTQKERKFVRNAGAYTINWMGRIVRAYLGKLGTAYTFRPATTPKGKAKRIGTLWEAIITLPTWAEHKDEIRDDMKNELINSQIFVTVDLEEGYTPEGFKQMSESDVKTEGNRAMAELIGTGIREAIKAEDWIRILALLGAGGFVVFVAQSLGIIG